MCVRFMYLLVVCYLVCPSVYVTNASRCLYAEEEEMKR